MTTSRRKLLKTTYFLGLTSLLHHEIRAEDLSEFCVNVRKSPDCTLITQELTHPFSIQQLAGLGQIFSYGYRYHPQDKLISVGHPKTFLIEKILKNRRHYFFAQLNLSESFSSFLQILGKCDPLTTDKSGKKVLLPFERLLCAVCLEDKQGEGTFLSLVLWNTFTRKIKVIFWDIKKQSFYELVEKSDFELPENCRIKILPYSVFPGLQCSFLVLNENERRIDFCAVSVSLTGKEFSVQSKMQLNDCQQISPTWQFDCPGNLREDQDKVNLRTDTPLNLFFSDEGNQFAQMYLRSDGGISALKAHKKEDGSFVFREIACSGSGIKYCDARIVQAPRVSAERPIMKNLYIGMHRKSHRIFLLVPEKNSDEDFVLQDYSVRCASSVQDKMFDFFFGGSAPLQGNLLKNSRFLVPSQETKCANKFYFGILETGQDSSLCSFENLQLEWSEGSCQLTVVGSDFDSHAPISLSMIQPDDEENQNPSGSKSLPEMQSFFATSGDEEELVALTHSRKTTWDFWSRTQHPWLSSDMSDEELQEVVEDLFILKSTYVDFKQLTVYEQSRQLSFLIRKSLLQAEHHSELLEISHVLSVVGSCAIEWMKAGMWDRFDLTYYSDQHQRPVLAYFQGFSRGTIRLIRREAFSISGFDFLWEDSYRDLLRKHKGTPQSILVEIQRSFCLNMALELKKLVLEHLGRGGPAATTLISRTIAATHRVLESEVDSFLYKTHLCMSAMNLPLISGEFPAALRVQCLSDFRGILGVL